MRNNLCCACPCCDRTGRNSPDHENCRYFYFNNGYSVFHIYSGVKSNLKRTAVWVHKSSHAFQTPFWSCHSSRRLQLSYYSLILSSDRTNIFSMRQINNIMSSSGDYVNSFNFISIYLKFDLCSYLVGSGPCTLGSNYLLFRTVFA